MANAQGPIPLRLLEAARSNLKPLRAVSSGFQQFPAALGHARVLLETARNRWKRLEEVSSSLGRFRAA
eukprot:15476519-Alexandrium_andersonii.AAC.1